MLSLLIAAVALAVIGVGGSLIGAQSATFYPSPIPVVGPTSTVCTVGAAEPGSSTAVAAAVIRQAPGREGTLTATSIGESTPTLTLTEQGRGRLLTDPSTSAVLRGEGVMATASSGQVFGTGASGPQGGLMAAPCTVPGTEHWFVGVGANATERSELILTNPDDSQAEVDLQFFGPQGLVVVPGSPGVIVEANGSRTISLESLVQVPGPLSVSVSASVGRVTAVTRDLRSKSLKPDGADWHLSAVMPGNEVIIPDVPEGEGTRELVIANPGTRRAEVGVQVLGQLGAFAPAGAETVEVPPESTAAVDLAPGLAGVSGAIRLVSDEPVTGSVRSSSLREGAQSDIAIQSATPALVRTGVVALATAEPNDTATGGRTDSAAGDSTDSELILSNASDVATTVSFEVVSYDGVSQRQDDVLIGPHSTSTRRLNTPALSFLVVRVLDGSAVHGGVVFSQPDGAIAGLASVSLTSPDVASRAPDVVIDPSVGR